MKSYCAQQTTSLSGRWLRARNNTMKRIIKSSVLLLVLAFGTTWAQEQDEPKTDAEIRQVLISESIARYSGSCPCPYNRDRAGRRCGKRSAYSRPGGASPLCYERDVSQKMVDEYRARQKKHEKGIPGLVSPETWRGIVIAPEQRCSPYSSEDYSYPQSVEQEIVDQIGQIYGPYTGMLNVGLSGGREAHRSIKTPRATRMRRSGCRS